MRGSQRLSYQYVTITNQYTPPGWLTLGAKQAPSEYPEICGFSTCPIPLGSLAGSSAVQARTPCTSGRPIASLLSRASFSAMCRPCAAAAAAASALERGIRATLRIARLPPAHCFRLRLRIFRQLAREVLGDENVFAASKDTHADDVEGRIENARTMGRRMHQPIVRCRDGLVIERDVFALTVGR